ncbi:hypothetical protein [Streptomyces sp. NPDC005752]|uniref:hypothetical protein n=1 Tax=Streptomyces sp. NPDC005752 TaxID=3157065 RepID=UPI0033CADBC9
MLLVVHVLALIAALRSPVAASALVATGLVTLVLRLPGVWTIGSPWGGATGYGYPQGYGYPPSAPPGHGRPPGGGAGTPPQPASPPPGW